MSFTLKTYRPGTAAGAAAFFILNKGLNSGKPLRSPCPNCFILTPANASQMDFYYWLCFGLWQSRAFHPWLKGSCIEFITIDETRHIIRSAAGSAASDSEFPHAVKALNSILDLENNLRHQLVKLGQVKQGIFRKYIR